MSTIVDSVVEYQMWLELHRAHPCEELADKLEVAWVAMLRAWTSSPVGGKAPGSSGPV